MHLYIITRLQFTCRHSKTTFLNYDIKLAKYQKGNTYI